MPIETDHTIDATGVAQSIEGVTSSHSRKPKGRSGIVGPSSFALVAAALLLASGCTGTPENGGNTTAIANSSVMNDVAANVADPDNVQVLPPRPALNVAPDGLSLVDVETGSTRHITFGMAQDETMAVMRAALGTKPDEGHNAQCAAGPLDTAEWYGGLQLLFQADKFVGWSAASGGKVKIANAAGIGIGSTRDELTSALDAKIDAGPLGTEFRASDLSGLLSSNAPDAKITKIWAGMTCLAH